MLFQKWPPGGPRHRADETARSHGLSCLSTQQMLKFRVSFLLHEDQQVSEVRKSTLWRKGIGQPVSMTTEYT